MNVKMFFIFSPHANRIQYFRSDNFANRSKAGFAF